MEKAESARDYLGRQSVARNLCENLSNGVSAIVAGGPRMGKTTFLRQVAAELGPEVEMIAMDLESDDWTEVGRRIAAASGSVTLLLDGCDALLPDPKPLLTEILNPSQPSGAHPHRIVWAGGLRWSDWALAHREDLGGRIRHYPLIVLPPREGRAVLRHLAGESFASDEIERRLQISGGHPYLLARLAESAEPDCDDFFLALSQSASSPTERAIVNQLARVEGWIPLQDLKDSTGGSPDKTVLDRLATLGLIARTLVDGAAAARLVSPRFAAFIRFIER